MHPGSRPLRSGALVGSRLRLGHVGRQDDVQKMINQEASGQNHKPWSPQSGIWTQAGRGTTEQPLTTLRTPARQPANGRPGQGSDRSLGQRTRATTPVLPRMLERQRCHEPPVTCSEEHHSRSWSVAHPRCHRRRFISQEGIRVLCLLLLLVSLSFSFFLFRLISVWVLLSVSLFSLFLSRLVSLFGFHFGFHCSPCFSLASPFCLGFIMGFIVGFIDGWELCRYRGPNCYESQEDGDADIKGGTR